MLNRNKIDQWKVQLFLEYGSSEDIYNAVSSGRLRIDRRNKNKARAIEELIIEHPLNTFWYVRDFIAGRFELGEPILATDSDISYLYAKHYLKGRFELGEKAIASHPNNSFLYAKNVIKGRFELGEKAIATFAYESFLYAKDIIRGKFELGEPTIARSSEYSYKYAKHVLKGPFLLYEQYRKDNRYDHDSQRWWKVYYAYFINERKN